MREILFRGKAINRIEGRQYRTNYKNGDWVYGLIERLYDNDFPYLPATMRNTDGVSDIDIDYTTIGQYTGLTDKNGKKIFEGDILRYFVWGSYECFAVVRIGEYEQDGSGDEYPAIKICGVYVEVKKYCPLIKEDGDYFPEYLKKSSLPEIGKDVFELVGNIHDNPELLTGGDE